MTRMGMDVDLVEEKGRALKADAEKIAQLVRQIDALVRRLQGIWDGQDGREFVNTWWPRHKQSLLLCVDGVSGLGQSALNNAGEQREVSGTPGSSNPSGPGLAERLAGVYGSLAAQTDQVSKVLDSSEFGLVLAHGSDAVELMKDATAWGKFTDVLGVLGVVGGGVETLQGSLSGDVGKIGSGVVDTGLSVTGVFGGAAAAPVVVPLMVAKTFIDATIPYSAESQQSLHNYESQRVFGKDQADLSPQQSASLNQHYDGFMGVVNSISDKMDQTAQPISDAGDEFFRWVGLKK